MIRSLFIAYQISDTGTALEDNSRMRRANCLEVQVAPGGDTGDTALDTSTSRAPRETTHSPITTSQYLIQYTII